MLTNILLVGVGGAAGSILRYLAGRGLVAVFGAALPVGTLAVNVVGCFAAGCVAAKLAKDAADHPARLLLAVGLLGGLTTFSAFGVETVTLAQSERWGMAAVNVAANVMLGLGAAAIGFAVVRA